MSILESPVRCSCGWRGTVVDCITDIDGHDGGLGCPECERIVENWDPLTKKWVGGPK